MKYGMWSGIYICSHEIKKIYLISALYAGEIFSYEKGVMSL